MNRDSIVAVENCEAVNQDVGCATGGIVSHNSASLHYCDSRNIEAVGVEGEAAGRFGVKDSVLDGVVVAVQSHVPVSGSVSHIHKAGCHGTYQAMGLLAL